MYTFTVYDNAHKSFCSWHLQRTFLAFGATGFCSPHWKRGGERIQLVLNKGLLLPWASPVHLSYLMRLRWYWPSQSHCRRSDSAAVKEGWRQGGEIVLETRNNGFKWIVTCLQGLTILIYLPITSSTQSTSVPPECVLIKTLSHQTEEYSVRNKTASLKSLSWTLCGELLCFHTSDGFLLLFPVTFLCRVLSWNNAPWIYLTTLVFLFPHI